MNELEKTKCDFIDGAYIERLLKQAENTPGEEIERILDKAGRFEGLRHEEVAALLKMRGSEHTEHLFRVAGEIKEHIYGDRVVMFAPLYVSDHCVNKCEYCGFRCDQNYKRRKLTMDEVREEVRILESMGHKRLALEAGEDPVHCPIEYIEECLKTIYDMKFESGEIRRANVNIAAATAENYKRLKDVGIGTYILFQETYHRPTYDRVHISGFKKDYDYHATAFDRAQAAGIDDVGGGVLFGLYDPEFEVMGLMLHNEHLEREWGVGFHTISSPRLCATDGFDITTYPHLLSDDEFLRIVAIIRLAVPFTGMIISTRESLEMRKRLLRIGVSQLSAGSSVEVGGYSARENGAGQFKVADSREAGEIIGWLLDEGVVPSFCTACYRKGRTGDRFMSLAKSGNIKNVCLPNALMTLKEYALDYGTGDFRVKSQKLIDRQVQNILSPKVKALVIENLQRLEQGERDLYI